MLRVADFGIKSAKLPLWFGGHNTCPPGVEYNDVRTRRHNMTALRLILTAAFLLLTFSPAVVHACSCAMGGNGCGHGSLPDDVVVFLGKVTAKIAQAQPTTADVADLSAGYAVHFSVDESFHGGAEANSETVVYTGSGGGDCGYPFLVGTSYLVYASRYKGRLSTSICSGTNPEVVVGGLLKQLRAVRDTGHGFDLFGTVFVLPRGAGFVDQLESQPIDRVPVRAVGKHGSLFSTVTDEHGTYSFVWLPPDTYHLEQDLPAGLAIAHGTEPKPFVIEPDDKRDSSFGCRVDIYVRPDGQISGIVVDATGNGVPGFLTLVPTDPEEAKAAFQRGGLPGDETADGKFSLPQLPPGRYRLVFSPKIGSRVNLQQKFYWPASNAANSGAIEISLGQHVDNVRFEIPLSGLEQLAAPK